MTPSGMPVSKQVHHKPSHTHAVPSPDYKASSSRCALTSSTDSSDKPNGGTLCSPVHPTHHKEYTVTEVHTVEEADHPMDPYPHHHFAHLQPHVHPQHR